MDLSRERLVDGGGGGGGGFVFTVNFCTPNDSLLMSFTYNH